VPRGKSASRGVGATLMTALRLDRLDGLASDPLGAVLVGRPGQHFMCGISFAEWDLNKPFLCGGGQTASAAAHCFGLGHRQAVRHSLALPGPASWRRGLLLSAGPISGGREGEGPHAAGCLRRRWCLQAIRHEPGCRTVAAVHCVRYLGTRLPCGSAMGLCLGGGRAVPRPAESIKQQGRRPSLLSPCSRHCCCSPNKEMTTINQAATLWCCGGDHAARVWAGGACVL